MNSTEWSAYLQDDEQPHTRNQSLTQENASYFLKLFYFTEKHWRFIIIISIYSCLEIETVSRHITSLLSSLYYLHGPLLLSNYRCTHIHLKVNKASLRGGDCNVRFLFHYVDIYRNTASKIPPLKLHLISLLYSNQS